MELEFSDKGSLSNSRVDLVRGSQSMQKFRPMPVTISGISVASTFWLVSGFLLIAGLIVTAGFPNWVSMSSPPAILSAKEVKIGLFYFCYTPGIPADDSLNAAEECSLYVAPEFKPSNLTNLALIDTVDVVYLLTSSICYGFGTGLLIISLMLGIVAYCKPRIKDQSVFLVAFVVQLFGCIFLLVAMVLLPLVFHSEFMRQFCGSGADYYMRGKCGIEWSTQVAMVIISLTFYLPPFAIFSMNVSDGLRAYNCC